MKKRKPYKNSIPESKWKLVKDEYVRGYVGDDGKRVSAPTGKELIERHQICRSTFYARCRDESWDSERYAYFKRMKDATDAKYIHLRVEEAFKFDSKCFNYAATNLDRIQAMWADADPKDVPGLASAMEKVQKIARLTIGETTEVIKNVTDKEEDDALKEFFGHLAEARADRQKRDGLSEDVVHESTDKADTTGKDI